MYGVLFRQTMFVAFVVVVIVGVMLLVIAIKRDALIIFSVIVNFKPVWRDLKLGVIVI